MSMHAIVLDSNMEPISDEMEIKRDKFFAAEAFAAEAAANGTKCCIQWSRPEDGQTAYWGPAGAVFKPHWYVRMGRPELPPADRSKPRTIWMTDAEWAKVRTAPKGWVRSFVQKAKAPQA
jgi:hypothetical protein